MQPIVRFNAQNVLQSKNALTAKNNLGSIGQPKGLANALPNLDNDFYDLSQLGFDSSNTEVDFAAFEQFFTQSLDSTGLSLEGLSDIQSGVPESIGKTQQPFKASGLNPQGQSNQLLSPSQIFQQLLAQPLQQDSLFQKPLDNKLGQFNRVSSEFRTPNKTVLEGFIQSTKPRLFETLDSASIQRPSLIPTTVQAKIQVSQQFLSNHFSQDTQDNLKQLKAFQALQQFQQASAPKHKPSVEHQHHLQAEFKSRLDVQDKAMPQQAITPLMVGQDLENKRGSGGQLSFDMGQNQEGFSQEGHQQQKRKSQDDFSPYYA